MLSPYTIIGTLIGICVLFLLCFYFFIQNNQYFAANFADYDLRPVIGEKNTLSIEALFFNLQDKVNQINYHLSQSSKPQTVMSQITTNKTISGMVGTSLPSPQFTLMPLTPLIASPLLENEGKWTPVAASTSGVLMAETQYRPDPQRPYAIVDLVKLNMGLLHMGAVAGTQQPGGYQNPGPGIVPFGITQSNNLLAAFNGGFQQKDGDYGMIVGTKTYLPLLSDMATLVIYKDNKPQIIRYQGSIPGTNIIAIRQNGPMLIENGNIVTSENAWNMQTWGLTVTNSMYTWRSGIGVTADGNVIYAAGPSLVPETLAQSLLAAGATNAMQLDINPVWVRFVQFTPTGFGRYTYSSLDPKMINGGYQYLHGYQKDFFYIYE